ncbi:MAG: hypothetical protein NXH83_13745 [Rhodobacteraceae bacterium]|nr:hypothetical protein [Paracoccaceae bacterium]
MRTRQLCFALMLASSTAVADPIPGSAFKVGNWEGGAYSFDDTGAFSHCSISAGYISGDTLYFTVNRQATVTVAVGSPGLTGIPVGQSFPVALYVDRRAPFYGTATVLLDGFAALEIPEFDRALESFKRGYVLTIQGAGREGQYDLTGTFRALEATRQCAIRYFNYASAPSAPAPAPVDKTVTFQLATTVLTGLGIQDFRFLSQSELDEIGQSNSVAWVAPDYGLFGWSLLVPREPGQDDLRATDAGDTAYLAQGCNGDYATSARSIALKDGDSARELRLICSDADGEAEHFVSKFFAGDFVVYNALTFVPGQGDRPADKAPPQWSEDATLRAASFFAD